MVFRIFVSSPCMLRIDYCCVVSVTIGEPECSDDGQDIDISKYFVGSGANSMHAHVVWESLPPYHCSNHLGGFQAPFLFTL